jgi:DNA-directed RNA polymerase omega subunit
MTDRTKLPNAFEFVTVASRRAQQLQRGCTPRVDGAQKPARLAEREVLAGLVTAEPEPVAPTAAPAVVAASEPQS